MERERLKLLEYGEDGILGCNSQLAALTYKMCKTLFTVLQSFPKRCAKLRYQSNHVEPFNDRASR